jgi:hypothetical protein
LALIRSPHGGSTSTARRTAQSISASANARQALPRRPGPHMPPGPERAADATRPFHRSQDTTEPLDSTASSSTAPSKARAGPTRHSYR